MGLQIQKTRFKNSDNTKILHPETSADIVKYNDKNVKYTLDYIMQKINILQDIEDKQFIYEGNCSISQFPNIEVVKEFKSGDTVIITPILYLGDKLNFISVFGYTEDNTPITLNGNLAIGEHTSIFLDRDYIKIRAVFNLTEVEDCIYICKIKKVGELNNNSILLDHEDRISHIEEYLKLL